MRQCSLALYVRVAKHPASSVCLLTGIFPVRRERKRRVREKGRKEGVRVLSATAVCGARRGSAAPLSPAWRESFPVLGTWVRGLPLPSVWRALCPDSPRAILRGTVIRAPDPLLCLGGLHSPRDRLSRSRTKLRFRSGKSSVVWRPYGPLFSKTLLFCDTRAFDVPAPAARRSDLVVSR